ncbi:hypothetical protein WDQ52_004690 [Salmonella enterica]
MRSFILDLTPERWEKLKASPGNFPITEADLPSQPEPVTNHPYRYRLKVTFNMTSEQVKQRYGCPFTPLSDMLRKYREEKERVKLEKARRILASKVKVATKIL